MNTRLTALLAAALLAGTCTYAAAQGTGVGGAAGGGGTGVSGAGADVSTPNKSMNRGVSKRDDAMVTRKVSKHKKKKHHRM